MTDHRISAAIRGGMEHVLPRFEDNLMGIPIILVDSAVHAEVDGESGVIVPDLEGLRAAVAVARVRAASGRLAGRMSSTRDARHRALHVSSAARSTPRACATFGRLIFLANPR